MKKPLATLAASMLTLTLLAGCSSAASDNATSTQDSSAQTSEEQTATSDAKQIQYVMYVGTNDKDTNQPVMSPEESLATAKSILIKRFGGYTIQEASGGWIGDDGTEYQEYTMVIYLNDTTEDDVHEAAKEFIKTFNQSAILIQADEVSAEFYEGA